MKVNTRLIEVIATDKVDVADMKDVPIVTFADYWYHKNDLAISEDGTNTILIGFNVGKNTNSLFLKDRDVKAGEKYRLKLKD